MSASQTKPGRDELLAARRQSRPYYWFVAIFSICVNILMLTGPMYMMQVYDRVLGSRSEATLIALSVLVIFLYSMMGILDFVRGRVMGRVAARFQSALDLRVFDAVVRRAAIKPDSLSQTGLKDLESIQRLMASPVTLALFDIPMTPFFILGIMVFHPWLGYLALAGGGFLIIVTIVNQMVTRTPTLKSNMAVMIAEKSAEQIQSEAEMVQALGMRGNAFTRWMMARGQALSGQIGSSDLTGFFSTLTKSFRLLLQSAMLGLGAYLVLLGELTPGAMIAGSILMGRALAPIEQTIGQWPAVQRARAAWASLAGLLQNTPPEPETHALPQPSPNVLFKGVSVISDGAKGPTLSGVSFYLAEGEVLGVIGKSGSGKSTLAKSMLGLTRVVSGEVRFGGATLDQYGSDALGAYVGYLPQNVVLFNGTIAENIARMTATPDDAKIVEAAKRANAHEMILSLPDGYKTMVLSEDSQLSGGQKQRIALARAFYGDPVLLVLDEPNSALDNDGSIALNQAIREFKASNRSVVILTHRPSAISECDRLLVIDEGRIKADGPRDEVLKSMVSNVRDIQRSMPKEAQS